MNHKELRIGNYINMAEYGISPVDIEDLEFIEGCKKCNYTYIKLTEEWLEKFGFIKKYAESAFEEGGYYLDKNGNRVYSWIKGVFNLEIQSNGEIWFEVYSHYNHIEYVHQLQNLYFALTNEELTLIQQP
jgi:hypothetical protein